MAHQKTCSSKDECFFAQGRGRAAWPAWELNGPSILCQTLRQATRRHDSEKQSLLLATSEPIVIVEGPEAPSFYSNFVSGTENKTQRQRQGVHQAARLY